MLFNQNRHSMLLVDLIIDPLIKYQINFRNRFNLELPSVSSLLSSLLIITHYIVYSVSKFDFAPICRVSNLFKIYPYIN